MELFAVILMIAAGAGIAAVVTAAFAISSAGREEPSFQPHPDRGSVAASILFQVLVLGGASPDQAARKIMREAGLGAPITRGIDIASWGESFAGTATAEQRALLLETAVRLATTLSRSLPLAQYRALLDLSFALGFQTDTLARLRQRYGFGFEDPAREGRPRGAEGGGARAGVAYDDRPRAELLRALGIEGTPNRQAIIAAYRKLAAQHHPDKYFGEPTEVQRSEAARFIEITKAYEALLIMYPERL